MHMATESFGSRMESPKMSGIAFYCWSGGWWLVPGAVRWYCHHCGVQPCFVKYRHSSAVVRWTVLVGSVAAWNVTDGN